jgi:hypothetical protein
VGVDGALVDAGSIWSTKMAYFCTSHIWCEHDKKEEEKKFYKIQFQNYLQFLWIFFFLIHLKGDNKKVQLKAPEFAKHVITSNLV